MTIVVTGAGGGVGRAVVEACRASGQAVRGVVRPDGSAAPAGCESAVADVRDETALRTAFDGATAVVHAAARMAGSDEEIRTSVADGTRAALAAALTVGARAFVQLSTVAVYGGGHFREADESHPLAPSGVYAESKAEAEEVVRAAADDLAVTVLRPMSVYGKHDRYFTPYLLNLAEHGVLPLLEGGAVRQDVVATTDLARAALLAAARTEPGATCVYNVTSGPLTLGEMATRVRESLGLPARTVAVESVDQLPPDLPPDLVRQVSEHRGFSIERARADLGYEPSVSFPGDL